uniref:Uncharacterized protein n=1 Tax=Sphaerodactylus townsendi TaxID=933632 RepID=A0ACB8EP88_9SAUR
MGQVPTPLWQNLRLLSGSGDHAVQENGLAVYDSRSIIGSMPKEWMGVFWQAVEVALLLQAVRQNNYAGLLMGSTHLPSRRAYEVISQTLWESGFVCMPQQ